MSPSSLYQGALTPPRLPLCVRWCNTRALCRLTCNCPRWLYGTFSEDWGLFVESASSRDADAGALDGLANNDHNSTRKELSMPEFVAAMMRQLHLFIHRLMLKTIDIDAESSAMTTLMLVLKSRDLEVTPNDKGKQDEFNNGKDLCTDTDRDGTSRDTPTEMSEGPLYVCANCAQAIQHPYTEHVRALQSAGGLTPADVDHLSVLAGGDDGASARADHGGTTFRDLFQFPRVNSSAVAAGGPSKEMTVLMQVFSLSPSHFLFACVCVCVCMRARA